MFALKPISRDSVDGALAKAERYRLLNEPHEAESICRDILEVDPANRQARISLILALTDEIPRGRWRVCQRHGGDVRPGDGIRSHLLFRNRVGAACEGVVRCRRRRVQRLCLRLDRQGAAALREKRSTCGRQVTTTRFCAGTPAFVFSIATKSWGRRRRKLQSRFSRSSSFANPAVN